MIAFDLAYELTLGIACARDARTSARGWVVSAFVYVPICVASLVAWPGWQGMYLANLDGRVALAGASGAQPLALLSAYAMGLALGRKYVVPRAALVIAWGALLFVLFVPLHERAFTVTSYADFFAREHPIRWGGPEAMLGGAVMWFLIASGAVNAAALAVLRPARTRAAGR